MLIKRGDAEIITVIKDDEHKLDDEGTRQALKKAVKTVEKEKVAETKPDQAGDN